MKILKLLTVFLLLFTFSNNVKAQNDYRVGELYEGYIIKKDNSREEGYIIYQNPLQRREKVIFYKNKNDKRSSKKYKPKELNGYKVGSIEFRTIKYKMLMIKMTIFAEIVTKGHITVFNVANNYDEIKREYNSEMILQKGDDEAVSSSKFLRFSKKMSAYIKDHKELAKKVKNKEKGYRLLSMLAIIKEYNEWYETQNK
ncbi:MAG: hypothetical protein ACPG19_14305 [Saprospiraceae bacterium]